MNSNQQQRRWRSSTSLSFWGTTIQVVFAFLSISTILYVAYNFIDIALNGILSSIASMNLDYYEDRMMGFIVVVGVSSLISFLGYILYLIGICLFRSPQQSLNSELKTRNIMLTELIMPALLILFFVVFNSEPEMFIKDWETAVATIVLLWGASLAAIIYLRSQFNSLSKEDTWNDKARKGASNLVFSYDCIIWIQVVFIVGLGIIGLTVYSYFTKIGAMHTSSYGSYGMNEVYEGINSFQKMANDFLNTIKVEMVFIELTIFVFVLLWTIYRIMGWSKIKNGSNEEVYTLKPRSGVSIRNSGGSRFCYKCGTELPDGSSFCPSCGTPVTVVSTVENDESLQEQLTDSEITPEGVDAHESATQSSGINIVYEDEESDKKKKWMLWGGIAAGIIAVAVGLWAALWHRSDKFEPNANVFVIDTNVYKSIKDGEGESLLANLVYGTPVQDIADEKVDDIWTEVIFEQNGESIRGFINKHNIMNFDDFAILEAAGFDDENLRNQLPERLQRLAIAHAAKTLDKEWRVEILDDADTYANAKNVFITNASPSEHCFAFALENKHGEDERKAFVYSMPIVYEEGNIRQPIYLYDENIPIDQGTILDVTYNKRNQSYTVKYLMRYGYCGEDEEEYVTVEEISPAFYAKTDLQGQIDGKYDISMTFYENTDYSITGWYKYLKNDVPIELSGKFTNIDDVSDRIEQNLVIDEYVDGKHTGSFKGRFNGTSFTGKWISADGSKELPFKVTK